MDADVQQMMTDLGLQRRDVVSAPLVDSRGRELRETARDQEAVLAGFNARRERVIQAAASGGADERVLKLKAWNSETAFASDGVTEQLQNRYSGQGHRAALAASTGHSYNEQWEKTENRLGEERRLYLQEKVGANRGNYVASSPRHPPPGPRLSGADRFGALVLGRIPRGVPTSHGTGHLQKGVPSPIRRTRAPSPRAAGTVRFGPGGRRVTGSTSSPGGVAAPMLAPIANGTRAGMKPATRTTPTTKPVLNTPPRPNPSVRPPSTIKSSVSTPARPASSTATPVPAPTPPVNDVETLRNLARLYAAKPGPEQDEYVRKHPTEGKRVLCARALIVDEVTALATNSSAKDVALYFQKHPEARWMLDAAVKAKDLVRRGAEGSIDPYFATHPSHRDFLEAARKAHTPVSGEPRAVSAVLETKGFPTPTTAPTKVPVVKSSPDTTSPSSTMPLPSPSATTSCPATATADPEHTLPLQPSTALNHATIPVTTHDTLTNAQASAAPAASIQSKSSPSSHSTSGSSSIDSSSSTLLTPPSLPSNGIGTFTAFFYDFAGMVVHHLQRAIDAPLQVTLDVRSRAPCVDHLQLIAKCEDLAKTMTDRSPGLEGVKMSQDGLWEEI